MIPDNEPVLGYEPIEYFANHQLASENARMRSMNLPCPVGMGRLILKPGATSPLDQHRVAEAWLVASGEGTLIFKGKVEKNLVPGSIVVFDTYESHIVTNTGDCDFVFFSVWWGA